MKRILTLFLPLIIVLTFAACGSDNKKKDETSSSESIAEEKTVEEMKVTFSENYFDVTKYGAKGDGTADDTAALIKSLAAAKEESSENTIYFPKGSYVIAGTIDFPLTTNTAFADGAEIIIKSSAKVSFSGKVIAAPQNIFMGDGEFTGTLNNPYVYPDWFGAKGDGVTDDSSAFQRALAHSNEISVPAKEKGYAIKNVVIPSMKRIHGTSETKKSIIVGHTDCINAFEMKAGIKDVIVSNLAFDMSKTKESTCFFFNTINNNQLVGADNIRLLNIDTEGAYHVVRDAKGAPDKIYNNNIILDGLNCKNSRNSMLSTGNFWGFIFFRNLNLDNSKLKEKYNVDGNYPAIQFANNAGAILQNIKIIGTNNPANDKESGFSYIDNVATWMENCSVKNVGGNAIETERGSHLYFSNVVLDKMLGNGMMLNETYYIQCNKITISGCSKQKIKNDGKSGVYLNGTLDAQMNSISASEMTANGVYLANATSSIFTDLVSKSNTMTGYLDLGNNNVLTGGDLASNGTQLKQKGKDSVSVKVKISGKEEKSILGEAEKK